jgi:hypothetical protein
VLQYDCKEKEALYEQDFSSEFQAAALKAVGKLWFNQKDQSHSSPKLLLGRFFCLLVFVDISQQDNNKRGECQC